MRQRWHDTDLALLAEVAGLFEARDPAPAQVVADATAALPLVAGQSDVDRFTLCADSAGDPDQAVEPGRDGSCPPDADSPADADAGCGGGLLLRGTRPTARILGFTLADVVRLDVWLGPAVRGRRAVLGLVGPVRPASAVVVRWPRGRLRAPVDEVGRFRLSGVPVGPVSFLLHQPGATAAATDWFVS
ncbi:hypothetical protein [Goodfellowiella coeruleoviolacea]|uniref:Carboxypeptidase regulatory-like domain-containing protein n=1 Tax=Goodfellowiella coeruleoviolacea TaxID=334858 RepID=A0AAE3GE33_9PSEU|nr:hypothetical protein [Goodfellowiella coeruleoviolacea]MCP2166053.1 hypothetical protein [Goodfellowiella coeruleoviolacea]